jgi:large subunit ribosomal protein L21
VGPAKPALSVCFYANFLFDGGVGNPYNFGFRCLAIDGLRAFNENSFDCSAKLSVTNAVEIQTLRSLTMYAVIKTGGKQYRVAAGEKIKVEQIPADVGAQVVLDQVMMVGNGETVTIGKPLIAGAAVTATVISHGRADKVKIFKMRRRKHYQKHQGHRQNYTELQIGEIKG